MRLRQPLQAIWRSEARDLCHVCRQTRAFRATRTVNSGHNRWSKIKHDKAKKDGDKSRSRPFFARNISDASKFYGPDPNQNPQLASAIAAAKKEGISKDFIDTAIARGQGISTSGAPLVSLEIEALFPPDVAIIIECQTDNKNRSNQDIKDLIKDCGGTPASILYLFQKRGRIEFKRKSDINEEEVLEVALEAGALDVVDEPETIVVFTEVPDTKAIATALAEDLGLEIVSMEVLWTPKQDAIVNASSRTQYQSTLWDTFLDKIQFVQGYQRLYTNEMEPKEDDPGEKNE